MNEQPTPATPSPQLADDDATREAADCFGWLEKAQTAGMPRDETVQYLALVLQRMYARGAVAGVGYMADELSRTMKL